MKIAVLLCGDLAKAGTGLSLEELPSSLAGASPDISVEVVPDLLPLSLGRASELPEVQITDTNEDSRE